MDVGFRVLYIDSSNMADVYCLPDQLAQSDVVATIDNVKLERDDPEDLLFEELVHSGVDLTLPIRQRSMLGKRILFVGQEPYKLVACFDKGINEDLVKELAKMQPNRVIFRDAGYATDAVKINTEQIFKQISPDTSISSM